MTDKTTISIDKETRDSLKEIGKKGEDYDSIIKKNIKFSKKFNSESQFNEWFNNNFGLFGFDTIIKRQSNKSPDFIMLRNGKEVGVELETLSSNFIKHKHDPNKVDLVLCLVKDVDLPVNTIEISPFEYTHRMKTISVEDETWSRLTILRVKSMTKNLDILVSRLLDIGEEEILKQKRN